MTSGMKKVLNELRHARHVFAACPDCGGGVPPTRAGPFDATEAITGRGLEHLQLLQGTLAKEKADFEAMKKKAEATSRLGAQRVGIGKMVERIAPSLPGFPLTPADCRPLLEPIDYVAFPGLASTGVIESLVFVDVKSGKARLTDAQRAVRSIVERGRVSLVVTKPLGTTAVKS